MTVQDNSSKAKADHISVRHEGTATAARNEREDLEE